MGRNGGLATVQAFLEPNGFEQITVLTTSVGITAPDGTKVAMIQAEAQNVRWRDDGTDPTATVGMILVANDILVYSGKMAEIEFIEITAGAILDITYYK